MILCLNFHIFFLYLIGEPRVFWSAKPRPCALAAELIGRPIGRGGRAGAQPGRGNAVVAAAPQRKRLRASVWRMHVAHFGAAQK
jgi:hypothetical protein